MCRPLLILAAFCAAYSGVAPLCAYANDETKKESAAKTAVIPDTATITKIGVSLNNAFARRDCKLFRSLTTSDFSYTCSSCNGKTENFIGEKALTHATGWISGGTTEAIAPAANVVQFYTIEDTTAQADTIVLTMKHEVEYSSDSDKTYTYTTRQTWVRSGDNWKLKSLVRL